MKKIIEKIAAIAFAFALFLSFGGVVGNTTVKAADVTPVRATLTLGNARWVTNGASENAGGQKVGKYLLSWDLSVLDVKSATQNGKYLGRIWNVDETESYSAILLIQQNEIVVDTTSCKAALYVDTSDTTFKIKKDDVFTIYNKTADNQPDEIVMHTSYIVTCTLDSSVISITDADKKADDSGSGADVVAPVISYDGETVIAKTVGDCVPLVFATANDAVDGNVLVKSVWSDGAHDENYKMLLGTHTLTLTAKDKAGNVATVVITVNVSE